MQLSQNDQEGFLRDRLAVTRTSLSNERTLLAYVRTALTLIATGGAILEFLDSFIAGFIAIVLITIGTLTLPLGVWRYRAIRRQLDPGTIEAERP